MQLKLGCRGAWIALVAAAADRITKVLAVHASATGTMALVPGVLNANYVRNTGMAFSMFSGQSLALSLLTLALIVVLVVWLCVQPDAPRLFRTGLWMIVGGGIGNLYDRLAYGYVIDFLDLAFIRFAVFNIADVCICLGAGLAILSLIMQEIQKGKTYAG